MIKKENIALGTEAEGETTPDTVLLDKYTNYYMLEEGNFLYYYSASVGYFLAAMVVIGCLIGSCMLNLGANAVLKMVEHGMK